MHSPPPHFQRSLHFYHTFHSASPILPILLCITSYRIIRTTIRSNLSKIHTLLSLLLAYSIFFSSLSPSYAHPTLRFIIHSNYLFHKFLARATSRSSIHFPSSPKLFRYSNSPRTCPSSLSFPPFITPPLLPHLTHPLLPISICYHSF